MWERHPHPVSRDRRAQRTRSRSTSRRTRHRPKAGSPPRAAGAGAGTEGRSVEQRGAGPGAEGRGQDWGRGQSLSAEPRENPATPPRVPAVPARAQGELCPSAPSTPGPWLSGAAGWRVRSSDWACCGARSGVRQAGGGADTLLLHRMGCPSGELANPESRNQHLSLSLKRGGEPTEQGRRGKRLAFRDGQRARLKGSGKDLR